MKTPRSLEDWLNSALVSLTLLAFASLMLALPLYRVAAAKWPEPIVEQVYPDGRVSLRESLPLSGDDGVVRSRPLNAARIEFDDQARVLGYVVAIRSVEDALRTPPGGTVWRPGGEDCELGVKAPGRVIQWVACNRVTEVSRPNRMHFVARARLAFSRGLPGLSEHWNLKKQSRKRTENG